MNENNLNNESKENISENNKKTFFNSIYKILISIFMILLAISGVILFKSHISTNKEKVEVTPLSKFQINNNEIFNVNKHIKEGLSTVDIKGENGGGRYDLNNSHYINFSYSDNDQILIELYDNDNLLKLATTIKQKDYKDIDIYDAYVLKNDKIILSISGMSDNNKIYTNLTTLDMDGEILSELILEDMIHIEYADTNGMIVSVIDNDYNHNKIIKFNNQNKKIFEYNFKQELYRVFFEENKTIVFTCSYKNKTEGVTLHIIDENGKEIFSKNNTNFNSNTLGSITQLSDGNFLIQEMKYINQKNYDGYRLTYITKVDTEFNEIWRKNMDKSYDFFDIIELNNEYYIYMQETYSIEEEKSQTKISSFTKIDSSGNITWCKYFGYDKNNEFNIVNNNEIHMDVPLYIKDEKIIFKGSVFENNSSSRYINISIDSEGNLY